MRSGFSTISRANKRQYREIVKNIDAEDVLDYYQADNVSLSHSSNGDELIHSCLIDRVDPHHSHGDSTPTACLSVDDKLYHCFAYGGGDLFWLLEKLEGSWEGAVKVIQKLSRGVQDQDSKSFLEEINKLLSPDYRVKPIIPTYSPEILDGWNFIHPYVSSRGVSDDVIIRHRVGYDPESNRITLPLFWNGELVGWQKRALPPQNQPKYQNSPGFPKSEVLYLGGEESDEVLVVESIFSVLVGETLQEKGLLPGLRLASTLGAKVSDEQIKLLRNYSKVIIWFDDDQAGKSGALRLLRGLSDYTSVSVVNETGQADDLAGLPPDEVVKRFENREVSFLSEARLKKQLAVDGL